VSTQKVQSKKNGFSS